MEGSAKPVLPPTYPHMVHLFYVRTLCIGSGDYTKTVLRYHNRAAFVIDNNYWSLRLAS